jgi:hypothetical protein
VDEYTKPHWHLFTVIVFLRKRVKLSASGPQKMQETFSKSQ